MTDRKEKGLKKNDAAKDEQRREAETTLIKFIIADLNPITFVLELLLFSAYVLLHA